MPPKAMAPGTHALSHRSRRLNRRREVYFINFDHSRAHLGARKTPKTALSGGYAALKFDVYITPRERADRLGRERATRE